MAGWLGAASGILGGISDTRAAKRTDKQRSKEQQLALGELTPEAISNLMRMFFTKYYGMLAPQMMGAQQGMSANLGRIGGTGMGVAQQLRAGIPGQFANMALGQSINPAMETAMARSKVYSANLPDYKTYGNWAGILSQGLQGFTGQYGGPKYS